MTAGVRGMTLDNENDEVIGMITLGNDEDQTIMVVSQNGYGKRSSIEDYPITNRGGKGVKTLQITDKTGNLVAIKNVNDNNDLMIINQSGVVLRVPVDSIRVMGRNTQGVKLIDLDKRGDVIASVCKVDSNPEESAESDEEDDGTVSPESAELTSVQSDGEEPVMTQDDDSAEDDISEQSDRDAEPSDN